MPLDYGCWFDQHHDVENLRPNLVKPHPEEPVCAEQPRATWSLPPQDGHLMSQGDEFKLQGGAAANTEREQGNEGGKNCDHAHDGMAVARKSLAFLNFQGFAQPQAFARLHEKHPGIAAYATNLFATKVSCDLRADMFAKLNGSAPAGCSNSRTC